jgi:hypothetical protein
MQSPIPPVAYTNPSSFLSAGWMDKVGCSGKLALKFQQASGPRRRNLGKSWFNNILNIWYNNFPASFENNIGANAKTELYCSPASIVEGFRGKIKACLTAKGVAYNHAVGGCQLTKLISMWNMQRSRFLKSLSFIFYLFWYIVLNESRICLYMNMYSL